MIYVCIPAHDEARTLGVLLWKIRNVMADFQRDYHILVLDDASTDDTAETLERYRSSLPLTVIRSEERLGYARAVERLLRETVKMTPYPKRDSAVVLQADFSEDPAELVPLVKILEGGADIVAGVVKETVTEPPRPLRWARRVTPLVLGRTFRKAPVSDPTTGFRAYRIIILKKAFREEEDALMEPLERWAANVKLLGELAPHARRIEEAPLHPRYHLMQRETRFRPLPALRDLFRIRGVTRWESTPDQAA